VQRTERNLYPLKHDPISFFERLTVTFHGNNIEKCLNESRSRVRINRALLSSRKRIQYIQQWQCLKLKVLIMRQGYLLSSSQLEEFQQNGYLLLKGILDPTECERFDVSIVQPAIKKYAGIDQSDPTTWNTDILKRMATGDYSREKPNILPGVMVRKEDGLDPIPDEHSLDLSALKPILDQLHGGANAWDWLHSNVGWIHVRFPLAMEEKTRIKDNDTWHVDGGHFTPHFIDSPEQSVVVLPMIRPVGVGGGNTLILKKSHIYIAKMLGKAGADGVPREVTQNASDVARIWPENLTIEIAPCDKGDVLIFHPFTVHAAGQASVGHPLRIAFNMGVRWRKNPIISKEKELEEQPISWLEKSIAWALDESSDFLVA